MNQQQGALVTLLECAAQTPSILVNTITLVPPMYTYTIILVPHRHPRILTPSSWCHTDTHVYLHHHLGATQTPTYTYTIILVPHRHPRILTPSSWCHTDTHVHVYSQYLRHHLHAEKPYTTAQPTPTMQ